ncbi:hypothetical protein AAG570_002629 [Ranatra chinensis]|uniref:Uncharacterized protein n=1 Tax=Ranatra chinensis TaxID=642074 RepID=A0ABD0YKD7_9HEMI
MPPMCDRSVLVICADLPDSGPVILADWKGGELEPGDTLRANCTTPPSKPAPTLSFTINGRQCWEVGVCERRVVPLSDSVQWSAAFLTMHVKPSHFTDKGLLVVRCTALIPGFYREETQISLKGTPFHQTVVLGSLGTRHSEYPKLNRNPTIYVFRTIRRTFPHICKEH